MASAGTTAAITLGAEAAGALDHWLDGRRRARAWFGNQYRTFTNIRPWMLNFTRLSLWPHQIRKVFVIHRDDWREILDRCLYTCSRWNDEGQRGNGECCWLHIYRSLEKDRRKNFLVRTRDAGSYISAVSARPAARVESWGLFVLAYANGAEIESSETPEGSLRIVLACRDFVITLTRNGAIGQISAHLEPRYLSIDAYRGLRPDQRYNLLENGYSYDQYDTRFEWDPAKYSPSSFLLEDRNTDDLKRTVLDDIKAESFRHEARKLYYECYTAWLSFDPLLGDVNDDNNLFTRKDDYLRDLKVIREVLLDQQKTSQSGFSKYDVPLIAKRQFEFLQEQRDAYQRQGRPNPFKPISEKFDNLYAVTRILCFCKCLPPQLSTRNTGTYISLA